MSNLAKRVAITAGILYVAALINGSEVLRLPPAPVTRPCCAAVGGTLNWMTTSTNPKASPLLFCRSGETLLALLLPLPVLLLLPLPLLNVRGADEGGFGVPVQIGR